MTTDLQARVATLQRRLAGLEANRVYYQKIIAAARQEADENEAEIAHMAQQIWELRAEALLRDLAGMGRD